MAQSLPETTQQWNVTGFNGLESLKFSEQPIPELGDTQVLVRSKAPVCRRTFFHYLQWYPN